MRRKSTRNARKSSPEKTVKESETPPKTRRSRRRKRSPSKSSDSEEEVTVTKKPVVEDIPDTTTKSHTPSDEETSQEPVWKVTSSDDAPRGEIQKLKICLTRPPPDSPEKLKPRRSKSSSHTEDDATTSSEDKSSTRRTRSHGSPFIADEELEEKKGKGKSKGKHKSKIEQPSHLNENEIQTMNNEISENAQVTPQSPSIDNPVDNENDSNKVLDDDKQNVNENAETERIVGDSPRDRVNSEASETVPDNLEINIQDQKNKLGDKVTETAKDALDTTINDDDDEENEPLSVIQKIACEEKRENAKITADSQQSLENTVKENEEPEPENAHKENEEPELETAHKENEEPELETAHKENEEPELETAHKENENNEISYEENEKLEITSKEDEKLEITSKEDEKIESNYQEDEKIESSCKEDEKIESSYKEVEKIESSYKEVENSESSYKKDENTESSYKEDEKTESSSKEDEKTESSYKEDEESNTLPKKQESSITSVEADQAQQSSVEEESVGQVSEVEPENPPKDSSEQGEIQQTNLKDTIEALPKDSSEMQEVEEAGVNEGTIETTSDTDVQKIENEASSEKNQLENVPEKSQELCIIKEVEQPDLEERPIESVESNDAQDVAIEFVDDSLTKLAEDSNTDGKAEVSTNPSREENSRRENNEISSSRKRLKRDNGLPKITAQESISELSPSRSKSSRKYSRNWSLDLDPISSLIKVDLETVQSLCPTIVFPEEPDLDLEPSQQRERRKSPPAEIVKKIERKVSVEYKPKSPERPTVKEENEDNSNIIAFNRKISIVDDTASKLKPPPSPAKNPTSDVLYITNLVRPYTLKQLKELLERTGKIKEDGFWTDRIKSKCYVHYEAVEEAEATRNALHGVQWPIGNGKKLIIDYATVEDLEKAKNPPPSPPAAPVQEMKVPAKENIEPQDNKLKSDDKKPREMEKKKVDGPVREWDIGKKDVHRERSRSRERSRKHRRSPSPVEDFISKKQRKAEEAVPQKLMDDLFLKTKATPSIYWQPLSPEEISTKQQQRLIRMEEHKRRMEESSRMKGRDAGRGASFRRRHD